MQEQTWFCSVMLERHSWPRSAI